MFNQENEMITILPMYMAFKNNLDYAHGKYCMTYSIFQFQFEKQIKQITAKPQLSFLKSTDATTSRL